MSLEFWTHSSDQDPLCIIWEHLVCSQEKKKTQASIQSEFIVTGNYLIFCLHSLACIFPQECKSPSSRDWHGLCATQNRTAYTVCMKKLCTDRAASSGFALLLWWPQTFQDLMQSLIFVDSWKLTGCAIYFSILKFWIGPTPYWIPSRDIPKILPDSVHLRVFLLEFAVNKTMHSFQLKPGGHL